MGELRLKVFPTIVGMNRYKIGAGRVFCRVPHDRGDEPQVWTIPASRFLCSPRSWG